MKKTILIALAIVVSLSCSKRVGQYNVHLNPSERRALSSVVKDSTKASFFIDTLAKAHRRLAKQKLVTRVDTFYKEAVQQKKEIAARSRYSDEEVERIKKEFQARIWSLLDSAKMKIGDRDAFVKTIAREAIPLLESGKANTDTIKIDQGHYHFSAWMYKGKLLADVKVDRTAIAVTTHTAETTITPVVNCPPPKSWWKHKNTWISVGFNALLLIVISLVVTRVVQRRT